MADANAPGEDHDLGHLPNWDLSDLYRSRTDPALDRDLETAGVAAAAFSSRYHGRVAALDGAALGAAVGEFERIDEILARLTSYAQLVHAGDLADPQVGRFYQDIQEKVTTIASGTLFFNLEMNQIEEGAMAERLKAPALARYAPWVKNSRAYRPHQLAEDMERLLHEKHVAGRAAWIRLFDETMAALRFEFGGRALTSAEVFHLLSDRDATVRRDAARSVGRTLGAHARIFAHITNTLAKDKEIEDRWRHFARPTSSRNLSNQVEDGVVEALVAAVRGAYPRLSHRYYALKARWFGAEQLDYWDRNAPLPEDDDRTIPWTEARDTVLAAYGGFSGELARVGRQFFDRPWIDAGVRPGKAPGAFAHPTVPSAHPYLLVNYQGKVRDVMTLAHELGHGVHQVLAAGQGHFLADTPLTLAETASVFGEMLTFRRLLEGEGDPRRRRALLAGKVEDMLNTVVRQVAFFSFEERVHAERREGEITAERLGDIWMDVQRESLGPALRFEDDYRCYWSYIPHFIHSPFYVYAYAFGDCLVNSLYAAYQAGHPKFAEAYLDMLRAGGTLRHGELLAPFGLDAGDPAFWEKGLSVIAGFVDELETMA
ncbi:MAG: M3 family oligoendopeptidase [Alphaproteobacteria bacterium]|nr:M3 family oligoendopeptidase [Alphaproteobacteria bacterium]